MDNRTIAQRLTEYADYLASKRSNLYRVQAYRRAAETILGLDRQVEDIVAAEGRKGLQSLPAIGPNISFTITNLVQTGAFHTLRKRSRKSKPLAEAAPAADQGLLFSNT